MLPREKHKHIVRLSFKEFEKIPLQSTTIVHKLKAINITISEASMTNLKKGKPVGALLLKKAAEGFLKLLKREHGLEFDEEKIQFKNIKGWIKDSIKTEEKTSPFNGDQLPFKKGRFGLKDKVALYEKAEHTIIELGVRLKTFSNYLSEESYEDFRFPIINLLKKGIHFHCYIPNHQGRFAEIYFKDRDKVQEGELKGFEEIPIIREKLVRIFQTINQESDKGKMHLHVYNNLPYFHASIIDGHTSHGLMYINQYLYGIERPNSPSFKLSQSKNKIVFEKYWKSLQFMIDKKYSKEIPLK